MEFDWFRFLLVAVALVVSPGPDSLLIVRNTLICNRRIGLATVGGVQCGVACHAGLSIVGLSLLLYASETAFGLLAVAGSLYLAWLGLAVIRSGGAFIDDSELPPLSARQAFRQGMLCNLLNPKVLTLFIVLMPSFVGEDSALSRPLQIVTLSLILLAVNIPFQVVLTLLAERILAQWRSPSVGRAIQWMIGGSLIVIAVLMFFDHFSL